jgi:hypothetical protein
MLRWTTALLATALVAATTVARAQTSPHASRMVVDVPADDLYHQPACSLVRAAGSKVKVMRQAEAVRRGMQPHVCDAPSDPPPPSAIPVYIQAGDKRYHKEGCTKLGSGATKTNLDEAGRSLWPCAVCKPPKRQAQK